MGFFLLFCFTLSFETFLPFYLICYLHPYVNLISSCYFRKCDVITRGFSGYNTRWCRVILPDILKEFDPEEIAFATIFLGANDSNLPENTVQHVPLPRYRQDLKDMVEMMMVHMHFNVMFIIIVHLLLYLSPSCQ